MKKLPAILGSATLILSLAACGSSGSGGDQNSPSPSATPTPTYTAEAEARLVDTAKNITQPEKSERGNIPVDENHIGLLTGKEIPKDLDAAAALVSFKSISPTTACPSAEKVEPSRGTFLEGEAILGAGFEEKLQEIFKSSAYTFDSKNWSFVSSDGTTTEEAISAEALKCMKPADRNPELTNDAGPANLIFDVPATEGYVVYKDPASGASWEWKTPYSLSAPAQ